MKQPHYATSLKLSKLCRWLALAVTIKLAVIVTLSWDLSGWSLSSLQNADTHIAQSHQQAVAPAVTASNAPAQASIVSLPVSQAHAAEPAPAPAQDALTRESLQRKQDELNRQEQDMKRLQQELDQKIQDLQALETRLNKMLKQAEEQKDKKMRHLVDVYSNMKAKQAAQVLETLDEKIAVKILAGMRGRQAGEILTFVTPAKAARLSEALTKMQLPFE